MSQSVVRFADRIPTAIVGLVIRVGVADVFWRSGQTKVDGWHVTETAVQLFRDEYRLPVLTPEVAATLAAVSEHLFSALLLVGLAARLSALGLLVMTLVIEVFVYRRTGGTPALVWVLAVCHRSRAGELSFDALFVARGSACLSGAV